MMRDMRKVKDRHIFELDNRQLVMVFAGLAVVCLLVFIAGVMVGSRTAKNEMLAAAEKRESRIRIKAPSLLEEKKGNKEAVPLEKRAEETVETPAPAPVPTAASQNEKDETLSRKTAPVKVEVPPALPTEAWFIQVASFQRIEDADRRAKALKERGYKVVVMKAEIPGKGAWHRVRLGPFESLDEAKALALEVEKREKISTFVTKGPGS